MAGWSFLSKPDNFNGDYADLSGGRDLNIAKLFSAQYADGLIAAPNWTPGGFNSMNPDLARVWKTNTELMVASADYQPEFVLIAGDLINGRWSWPEYRGNLRDLFGSNSTTLEQEIDAAAASFYAWQRKLWQEAGVDTVIAAIGDHEIGDDPWTQGSRADSVPFMKEAFGRHMIDPLALGATWKGVPRFAPPGSGQYDEGNYVYQNKNVAFVSVDVFRYDGKGITLDAQDGQATAQFTPLDAATNDKDERLEWLRAVLNAAENAADIDHVIIQGHTPVITPVNAIASSRLSVKDGASSPFWKLITQYGTNNDGKVRAYLNGEVHATTVIEDASSGIVQISHGSHPALAGRPGVTTDLLDPFYMAFTVLPDRIIGREFKIYNDDRKSDSIWQADRPVSGAVDFVGSSVTQVGTIEIDVSSGTSRTTVTGNLRAPLSLEGHQWYVGGPGDDYHEGGIPGWIEDNRLYGRGGNDTLKGRAGTDFLFGDDGNDCLDGGPGNDTISGGPGIDQFLFKQGFNGSDVITDFNPNGEKILIENVPFGSLSISQVGNDSRVSYSGGQILLKGVLPGSLSAADFGTSGACGDVGPPPPPPSGVVFRWNAGTSNVAAIDGGPTWSANASAIVGGPTSAFAGNITTRHASVPASTPTGVFAQERWDPPTGAEMGLEFGGGSLTAGTYKVRLFLGNAFDGANSPGDRVYDIRIEGQLAFNDFDPVARFGHKVGGMLEWQGNVTDGTVDIDFQHGVENPLINGVEVLRLDSLPPPPPPPQSGGFTAALVDAVADVKVATLSDGTVLTTAPPPAARSIDVDFSGDQSSFVMELRAAGGALVTTKVENVAPYSLTGDTGFTAAGRPDYKLPDFDFADGAYSLTVTAYAAANGSGAVLGTDTIDFSIDTGVAPPPPPSGGFTVALVDAVADVKVATLSDGTVLTTAPPPAARSIDVDFSGDQSSFVMELRTAGGALVTTKVENVAPYSLTGDTGFTAAGRPDYKLPDFDFSDGAYSLTVTAYAAANGSGPVLGTDTIDFTIDTLL